MGKLQVVAGGQYGSEGKGAIAAALAQSEFNATGQPAMGVRVAGPNAGHTVWGPGKDGEPVEFKLRSVPVAAVADRRSPLVIAAGSEIDIDVLRTEIQFLEWHGYNVRDRLVIDGQATMLTPGHIEIEQLDRIQERLGSTAKGIGAARAQRIWRYADLAKDSADLQKLGEVTEGTDAYVRGYLRSGGSVQIEGTQGYGLGLHQGNYPYCTSSDCRVIDFCAMVGINPWDPEVTRFEPWVVLRTRPIRVAGNSGELKGERTWAELGLREERTTVTNKVRRVGEWDGELAREAVEANGGTRVRVALTMLDQMFPEIVGVTEYRKLPREVLEYVDQISWQIGRAVDLVGTSPTTVVWL